jgi:hypothetical protein
MAPRVWKTGALGAVLLVAGLAGVAGAQESTYTEREPPYFVTYSDHLEEKGELEVELFSTVGDPGNNTAGYVAPWTEFEYGVMKWWTAELYLEGATIDNNGSAFTGWRVENRFRPFAGNHFVNPVLYIEYENISEASRIQKEIVGEGPIPTGPIHLLDEEHAHELEGRLILSSQVGRWNVSENFILEKNLSESEGVEFGYAAAVSRPLGAFSVGVEVYGGLGTTQPQFEQTRQFIAPVLGWHPRHGSMFQISMGFGVTDASEKFLFRVGYSFELK